LAHAKSISVTAGPCLLMGRPCPWNTATTIWLDNSPSSTGLDRPQPPAAPSHRASAACWKGNPKKQRDTSTESAPSEDLRHSKQKNANHRCEEIRPSQQLSGRAFKMDDDGRIRTFAEIHRSASSRFDRRLRLPGISPSTRQISLFFASRVVFCRWLPIVPVEAKLLQAFAKWGAMRAPRRSSRSLWRRV